MRAARPVGFYLMGRRILSHAGEKPKTGPHFQSRSVDAARLEYG